MVGGCAWGLRPPTALAFGRGLRLGVAPPNGACLRQGVAPPFGACLRLGFWVPLVGPAAGPRNREGAENVTRTVRQIGDVAGRRAAEGPSPKDGERQSRPCPLVHPLKWPPSGAAFGTCPLVHPLKWRVKPSMSFGTLPEPLVGPAAGPRNPRYAKNVTSMVRQIGDVARRRAAEGPHGEAC
jgi:hypothetical protein